MIRTAGFGIIQDSTSAPEARNEAAKTQGCVIRHFGEEGGAGHSSSFALLTPSAGRNPKSEGRNPKKIRNPKRWRHCGRAPFGFRISDLEAPDNVRPKATSDTPPLPA